METEKYEEAISEIINSDKFDFDSFKEYCWWYYSSSPKECVKHIANILQGQYMSIDVENILINNDKNEIIDFLNRLIRSKLTYKNSMRNKPIVITEDELEEFKMLASQTKQIPKEILSKTAPTLTVRTYMDMCRIAYDAMYGDRYPNDTSTAYIFCEARGFPFEHEYDLGIFKAEFDSPEEFAKYFLFSYHYEELEFGGLRIWINNKIACSTVIKNYDLWTGDIHTYTWDTERMIKSIKAYNALRKKEYPIYFSDYYGVYSKIKKLL